MSIDLHMMAVGAYIIAGLMSIYFTILFPAHKEDDYLMYNIVGAAIGFALIISLVVRVLSN